MNMSCDHTQLLPLEQKSIFVDLRRCLSAIVGEKSDVNQLSLIKTKTRSIEHICLSVYTLMKERNCHVDRCWRWMFTEEDIVIEQTVKNILSSYICFPFLLLSADGSLIINTKEKDTHTHSKTNNLTTEWIRRERNEEVYVQKEKKKTNTVCFMVKRFFVYFRRCRWSVFFSSLSLSLSVRLEFLYTTGWIGGIFYFTQLWNTDVTLRYTSTSPVDIDTCHWCPSEQRKETGSDDQDVNAKFSYVLLSFGIVRFDCFQIGWTIMTTDRIDTTTWKDSENNVLGTETIAYLASLNPHHPDMKSCWVP